MAKRESRTVPSLDHPVSIVVLSDDVVIASIHGFLDLDASTIEACLEEFFRHCVLCFCVVA